MTKEQIDQAFKGRWRIYTENKPVASVKGVKDLCHDFFTAGILLADNESVVNPPGSIFIDTDKIKLFDIVPNDKACKMALELNFPFELFWNMYDKKVGRPKCEKLWAKLTLAETKACLEYIPLYKQAQPDKQYRKNPETFLRNKSWNDELIYRNNGTDKPSLNEQRKDKLASILTE